MSPSSASSASAVTTLRAPNWSSSGMGGDAPTITSFDSFHLSKELAKALDDVGYSEPTPVQASCIPLVLAGIDLIVQSQTGTGKTAAFAIPTLEMLEPGTRTVEVLVLAPTRELANQVATEFERLAAHKDIPVLSIYGGTGFQKQLDGLKTAQVVCATPGRLLDLLNRKALTLDHLQLFVLDEADEMLNMGFEKEVDAIVERLPEVRQNLLFSATVTEDIKRLASHILSYPEYIDFSGDQVAAEEVKHTYYMVTGVGRLRDLVRVLEYENPENAIIFANTKDDTFLVTNFLNRHNISAEVLNGDMPQKEREKALARIKEGKIRFLVATDVAARGIDISDLSHVINLNLPESPEVYVHRTGRTGRAGKRGRALSLISPREIGIYYQLRRIYKIAFEERELPTIEQIAAATEKREVKRIVGDLDLHTKLDYGAQLANADRLLESDDARRYVAKLLAYFANSDEPLPLGDGKTVAVVAPPTEDERKRRKKRKSKDEAKAEKAEPKAEAAPVEEEAEPETVVEEEAPKAKTKAKAKKDKDDDKPGKRRRRRRRKRVASTSDDDFDDDDHGPVTPATVAQFVEEDLDGDDDDDDDDDDKADGIPEEVRERVFGDKDMVKLHVNLGAGKLQDEEGAIQFICDFAGLEPEDCGEVTLRRRWSYIMVREDMVDDIVDALSGQEYDGVVVRAELARQ